MRYFVASIVLALSISAADARVSYAQTKESPLKVGSDVPAPKQVKGEKPIYPENARKSNLRGVVVLELLINPEGRVDSIKVLRSVDKLTDAALAAAKTWEYEPTKSKGKPAWISVIVTIPFP